MADDTRTNEQTAALELDPIKARTKAWRPIAAGDFGPKGDVIHDAAVTVEALVAEVEQLRIALAESVAARANLEATIAEARAEGVSGSVMDVDVILARAGDPVVLQGHDAQVWDEGWDAGNRHAVDDFDRDPKASNPYRREDEA